MSKIDSKAPKLGSMLVSSVQKPAFQKEIFQGTIPRIMPDEKSSDAEVWISVRIKDVKYADKALISPEAVTIYNGLKSTLKIPFKEDLIFWFARVENEMVFKFAIAAAGDLLGFLYLELPTKFKSMKEFKLDDWFPVKLAEKEETLKVDNFVARVILNYKAKRALEQIQLLPSRQPKSKVYEELAKGMKARVADLHKELDVEKDEGFKFLTDVQRKIIKKKIFLREIKHDPSNKLKYTAPELQLNQEKYNLTHAQEAIQKDERIKNTQIHPEELYIFNEKKGGDSPETKEQFLKELAHTRTVLIEQSAKLKAMENEKTSTENLDMRKKIESAQDEIAILKKELTLRLKNQNQLWAKAQQEGEAQLEGLRENLKTLEQEEAKHVDEVVKNESDLGRVKAKLGELEHDIEKQKKSFQEREGKIDEGKGKMVKDERRFEELEGDLYEARQRIIDERQKMLEKNKEMTELESNLEIQEKALERKIQGLLEDKAVIENKLTEEESNLISAEKALQTANKIVEDDEAKLLFEKNDFAKQEAETNEEKKKLKVEAVRVWREKANAQEKIKNFMLIKKNVESSNKNAQEDLDKDYAFIDEQLKQQEKQKLEFEEAKQALEHYESFLQTQEAEQRKQQLEFIQVQKAFLLNLSKSQFEAKDLKPYADRFGVDMSQAEKRWREEERQRVELNKYKDEFNKAVNTIGKDPKSAAQLKDRRTMAQSRVSKVRASIANAQTMGVSATLKAEAQNKAEALLERLFSKVCVMISKGEDRSKEQMIAEVKDKIKYLQQEIAKERELTSRLQAQGAQTKESIEIAEKAGGQSISKRSFATLESVNIPGQMADLEKDLIKMCEDAEKHTTLDSIEDNVKARNEYVTEAKRMINSIFKALTLIHNTKKDFNNELLGMVSVGEQFDVDKMRESYERKIGILVKYIMRIRENYDFFNNNLDNQILKSS